MALNLGRLYAILTFFTNNDFVIAQMLEYLVELIHDFDLDLKLVAFLYRLAGGGGGGGDGD